MFRRALETLYYVSDLDAAIEEYTSQLGFRLIHVEEWGFAFLDADGGNGRVGLFSTEVFYKENPDEREGFPRPRMVFNVANLQEEIAALKRKGVKVSGISGTKGGTRSACFYDSDGNAFFMWETGTGKLYDAE